MNINSNIEYRNSRHGTIIKNYTLRNCHRDPDLIGRSDPIMILKTMGVASSLLLLIFAMTLFFPSRILAQADTPSSLSSVFVNQLIRVSPVLFNITLSPGKRYVYKIKVDNLQISPLPLQARMEGFDTDDEDGGYKEKPGSTSPLINWIKIGNPDLLIPSQSSRNLEISVSIPDNVELGGYYAVLYLTPVLSGSNNSSQTVLPKIGVIFLASIGVAQNPNVKKGEITEFKFGKWIYDKAPVDYILRVKNTSLDHFSAKPRLFIKTLFKDDKEFELPEKTILPGKIRRWAQASLIKDGEIGFYNVRLLVSLGKGMELEGKSSFIIFPYRHFIILTLSLLCLIYTVWNRKKVLEAVRIIVTGK